MKIVESIFDIAYLIFVIAAGLSLLRRGRGARKMGIAALVLGVGDAFHLVPRVLAYYMAGDLTAALGLGKLITSLTMTVFYVLLYYIYLERTGKTVHRGVSALVWAAAALRAVLCLLPQNGWFSGGGSVLWGALRNLPFLALGVFIILLYAGLRRSGSPLGRVWLYVALSFAFYLPVAVFAPLLPALGMLMLPKTVCYVLIVIAFLRAARREEQP